MQDRIELLEQMAFEVAETYFKESISASERMSDPDESFDDYLALNLGHYNLFRPTYTQYRSLIQTSRQIWIGSDIYKTALRRREHFILGNFLSVNLIPASAESVSEQLKQGLSDDFTKKAMENWTKFWSRNRMAERLPSLFTKLERDGTAYLRYFEGEVPTVRFVDPLSVGGMPVEIPDDAVDTDTLGVVTRADDIEDLVGFVVKQMDDVELVPAGDMQQFKIGADFDSLVGIPLLYQVLTNIRRADKMLTNISVLTTIQTAIAMIRKHDNANQSMISAFQQRNATGGMRKLSDKDSRKTKRYHSGTVLDAKAGTTYEFPAHKAQAHNWIAPIHEEISRVASCADIPVDWLLANENEEPISPSSPMLKAFMFVRAQFYEGIREMFWRVQEMMGLEKREDYELFLDGPVTPTAKPLDQARVDDIYVKHNAKSPQQLASENGRRYVITRSQILEHRKTKQPDEQFPSDVGMTNLSDGETKRNGDLRVAAGDGGDNS